MCKVPSGAGVPCAGGVQRAWRCRRGGSVPEVTVAEELIAFASKGDMLAKSKEFWLSLIHI